MIHFPPQKHSKILVGNHNPVLVLSLMPSFVISLAAVACPSCFSCLSLMLPLPIHRAILVYLSFLLW